MPDDGPVLVEGVSSCWDVSRTRAVSRESAWIAIHSLRPGILPDAQRVCVEWNVVCTVGGCKSALDKSVEDVDAVQGIVGVRSLVSRAVSQSVFDIYISSEVALLVVDENHDGER